MMTLDEARAFFKNDVFATKQASITIEAVGENYAKVSMPVTPDHKNAAGAVMGGALFTLADFAFAVAGNAGGNLTVTMSSNINFIGTCKGDTLYAETHLIKDGKRSCFFEIPITDNMGNLVATVTSNGIHLDKKLS